MKKALLTTREVGEYLGITPQEVRRLHEEGHLKTARGFRCPYKFARQVIEEYLERGLAVKM